VRGTRFAPLRVKPFGRLLSTYTINEIGDAVGMVALAVLVYDRTGDVAAIAAIFLSAKFLPALVAPAITARVDQLPLRRTLPAIYLVEAAVFGVLAVIADGDFVLGFVLVLALVDGSLALCARGLTRGAVACALQPRGMLREGNALMNVGFAIASVGGAALAGLLISKSGLATALAVDAASFFAIAILLALTSGFPAVDVEREPFRRRFADGFRYARHEPVVRLLLAGQAIALVLFTLIIPIEVIYAKESLGTTSAGYGILLASWGAGIVIGSLIYLRLRQRPAFWLVIVSTLAVGVAYVGLASANTLLAACLISLLGGAGNGVQWIAVMTALQEETPPDYQARITGMLESIGAAVPGVGYLLGGALVAIGSARTAYAVAGAGLVALVLAALPFRAQFAGHSAPRRRAGDQPAVADLPVTPPPPRGAPSGGA
jgi:predicted MFS family arabinose efflux permease